MSTTNLQKWPILGILESEFISQIHMVMVYGSTANEALIVTKDKMVYALGDNTNGCLGTGDEHSKLYPEKVEALYDKNIKTFACGSGPHVVMLTQEGEVYSWGYNNHYQLGNGTFNKSLKPMLVNIFSQEDYEKDTKQFIVEIACGNCHSIALTENGEVYTWGQSYGGFSNDYDTFTMSSKCSTFAENTEKIVKVACGNEHTLVLTDEGELYAWGRNTEGQLGIGNYVDKKTPSHVDALKRIVIVKVACGHSHTLALTNKGVLYAWGDNKYGQLGIDSKELKTCNPVMVEGIERVSDIAAVHYNNISIAVCKRRYIYMWGRCRNHSITTPTSTPFFNIYDAFACYGLPGVMHEPLILQPNKESNILECLRTSFDDSSTSDLAIEVEGQCIHVHKTVLKIRCSYFRNMFQHNWTENNQNVIKHDQFSYVVYKAFLKYLYTGVIDLSVENALELIDLANTYLENNLKKQCIQLVKQGITVSNVAYVYGIANEYNMEELENFCFQFALKNMTAVMQTKSFAELDEKLIKTFVIMAAKTGVFRT